jgi:hypothetical protein
MTYHKGIDFSTYLVPSVTPEAAAATATQLGVDTVLLGFDTAPASLAVKQTLMANGFQTWIPYRFVYADEGKWGSIESQIDDVVTATHRASANAADLPPYLVLDVEEDENGQAPTVAQIERAMARVEAADIKPAGTLVKPAIYSALWVWQKHYDGWTEPVDRGWALVVANWDGNPDPTVTGALFGGWKPEQVIGKQYAGNTASPLGTVDLDSFVTLTPSPTPSPSPSPSPQPQPPTPAPAPLSIASVSLNVRLSDGRVLSFEGVAS